jgi:hypothetical protein
MLNPEHYETETMMDVSPLSCRVARAIGTTAGKLSRRASYVKERKAQEMLHDARVTVRRNPGPSILTAVAAGLAIGWMFRK